MHALIALLLLGQAPARPIDACALIAGPDVSRILGADIKSARPVTETAGGVLLYQCYLSTGTPRSISIAVAGPIDSGTRTVTPRQFWREQFHSRRVAEHGAAGATRDADRAREGTARPIRGIGDEAFWSGTRVAGALYVLRRDTFIRVSVGGIQDERERIDTSRQLAAAAIARLPQR